MNSQTLKVGMHEIKPFYLEKLIVQNFQCTHLAVSRGIYLRLSCLISIGSCWNTVPCFDQSY